MFKVTKQQILDNIRANPYVVQPDSGPPSALLSAAVEHYQIRQAMGDLGLNVPLTPRDMSKDYGTLVSSLKTATFANSASVEETEFCPDLASDFGVVKIPGAAADPLGTITVTGLSLTCNTIKSVMLWAKGTARAGDSITTAYPIQVYIGVGGFTKYALTTCLLPADGEWHPLHILKDVVQQSGGFSFDSSDVVDRIRVKSTDIAQNGSVGFNAVTTGETLYIGPVRVNPSCRAKFMVRFDDSLVDLVQPNPAVTFTLPDGTKAPAEGWSCLSLLNHYGFRASVFHLPRRIGTSNALAAFATWDDLVTLKEAGWDNCFQSYFDPVNSLNDGIRLLGPQGYSSVTVSSVDATANTITASSNHGILLANAYYGGHPIIFSGSALPAPLVINKIYWAVGTTLTAFKLYPTEADAVAGTNVIDLTTTGTPASFTYRYAYARNDYTRYADDWTLGRKLLIDHGYSEDSLFVAMNQGATDGEVMKLAKAQGIKAVFGIYTGADPSKFHPQYPHLENQGTVPAINWKAPMKMVGAIQTDSTGAVTSADARNYVDKVVAHQCWGQNYHHKLNNQNGPCLAALLDQLRIHSLAGNIDVVTATELPL
jgi:hypothetical protein